MSSPAIPLSPPMKDFILHWGDMGKRWGINRTVAQVHALLYISPEALNAEQIAATLSVARSNVSTSVKELLSWGVIRPVPKLGDRRVHYESLTDVWEMFRLVVRGRKQRELDPTFVAVSDCLARAGEGEEIFRERMQELLEFFTTATAFYDELHSMPRRNVERLFKAGIKLRRLFGGRAS